jgi:hypothetical protein
VPNRYNKIELTEFVSLIAPLDRLLVERNKKVSEGFLYVDALTPNTTKQDLLSTPPQSRPVISRNDSCGQLDEMLSVA